MGIMNRRNALVGWLVLKIARRRAREKAVEVLPVEPGSGRINARSAAVVASVSALVVGIVLYVRRRASRPAPPAQPEWSAPESPAAPASAPEPDVPPAGESG